MIYSCALYTNRISLLVPLNQPIRRQSIIPQGPTTEFIDEKFYIPFVDEVAVDINLSKNLETKPMGSS